MKSAGDLLARFFREEEGQTTVEYMMVVSVLSIAIMSSMYVFGTAFATAIQSLAASLGTSLTEDGIRF